MNDSEKETITETQPKLSDTEMLGLERISSKRQIARLMAEKAAAEASAIDMQYRNYIMQLFLKHGLSEQDNIQPDGTITRGPGTDTSKVTE